MILNGALQIKKKPRNKIPFLGDETPDKMGIHIDIFLISP